MTGLPSAFAWTSTPFVFDEQEALSLTGSALSETPVASLVTPSATSGMGVLWVAQVAGAAGNNITVTINAPSGSTTSFGVVANAITVSPATGLTNAQLAMLAQQNASVWALVKPFVYGWGPTGPVGYSFQSEFLEASRNDLVAAATIANLVGGAASAAVNGTLTMQLSDDLINWVTVSGTSGSITTGGAALRLSASGSNQPGAGFVRWSWNPGGGGSAGELSLLMTTKGGLR
jgi:hypothetical protein